MDEAYLTQLLGANLSQSVVTNLINTGLVGYCPTSYVTTQAALNATKAMVDAGDAALLHIAQIGAASGVAGLNSVTGRIDLSHLSLQSTQRFPSPFYSPASYWSSNQTATTTELQIDTVTISNPGYTYKALITGIVDGQSGTDGQFPLIRIRQGSTTGPIVATGAGIGENFIAGLMYPYTTAGAGQIWTVPSWIYGVNRVVLGAGGGGGAAFGISGTGGLAGSFNQDTLIYGSTLPVSTPTLTVNVGAPGAGGIAGGGGAGAGGPTSITGIGVSSLTGNGGAGQAWTFNEAGQGASSLSYFGNIYAGGAQQNTPGGVGNAPGGGGSGGAAGGTAPGGAGASGAAWLFAYPQNNTPGGPIVILPAPLNAQTAMTGATTFYVMLASSNLTSSVTATALKPLLQVTPFPA